MKPKYTLIVVGVLGLVVGLALGFGGAVLLNRDQEPALGEVQHAELKVGDKAPEFELYDQTGTKVWLSDFRGQKNVVLAFYPAAWTPV
jgi:cytochrome oxidase Cu insertion factor (SCO1/SenC/PrrC family)